VPAPAVELGIGESLQTVVTLEYKVAEKENGLKSKQHPKPAGL
jgi:hypothetical protein